MNPKETLTFILQVVGYGFVFAVIVLGLIARRVK